MENVINLKAESRQDVGKKVAKQLRKTGRIPAIIYGEKKESLPISLAVADVKAILKSAKRENAVLNIQRDDIQVAAMLKVVQYDYLSDNIIHADLLRIDLAKKVNVNVHVEVEGVPIGVKVEGGIFDFMTRELRIRCLPTDIPEKFSIDVSELVTGDSIKADELTLPENVQLLTDSHAVICSVAIRGAAEEEEVVEEEEGEAVEGEAVEGETAEDGAEKADKTDKKSDKADKKSAG